jgi:hypothetical protein
VGEIKDEQTPEPGNTIAITDEINNFVKQFYTPEICTPRTKENINVIRPNFVKDLEQGSQDIKGQWTQDNDRFIDPLSDAKEYQITDVEGYKLIGKIGTITYPCFTYGYGQTFTVKGSVDQQKQEEKENAKKAQELGLNQSQYFVVDPNNTMLTLEDIDSKMVDYGKLQSTAEIKDAATKAMNVSNWTPNMGPNLPGTQ